MVQLWARRPSRTRVRTNCASAFHWLHPGSSKTLWEENNHWWRIRSVDTFSCGRKLHNTHTNKSHIYIYLHIYLYYRLLKLIYVSYPAKNEVFARVSIFSPVLVQFWGLNLLHRSHIIDTFESNSIKSVFKQLLGNPSQVDKLFAPSKQKMMIWITPKPCKQPVMDCPKETKFDGFLRANVRLIQQSISHRLSHQATIKYQWIPCKITQNTVTSNKISPELVWLVVSNIFYFPFHIWDVILPIDFHSIIFQDGHIAPPTSYVNLYQRVNPIKIPLNPIKTH